MESKTTSPAIPNAAKLAYLENNSLFTVGSTYLPLEAVTRPTVETAAAAFYLNRQQQTLRCWACHEDGPLRPMRINGRLAWKVSDLRRVLGVA